MKRIFALLMLLFSSSLLAASGWTGYGQISQISFQPPHPEEPDIYIAANLPNNTSGCNNTSSYMLMIDNARKERLLSMLMSAQIAKKEVRLYFTGECHDWGMAIIEGMYLR